MASCSSCGWAVETAPATWTVETTRRGRRWLCEPCTRDHLRTIEGRLDLEPALR